MMKKKGRKISTWKKIKRAIKGKSKGCKTAGAKLGSIGGHGRAIAIKTHHKPKKGAAAKRAGVVAKAASRFGRKLGHCPE
jgi:hypothetical protein